MPSENYSDFGGLTAGLLLEDTVTDRVSLFLEGFMILLFLLSAIYTIIKNKSSRTLEDIEDVQSLLHHITKQRKRQDISDELDSAVCDPATTEDESGGGVGSGDD